MIGTTLANYRISAALGAGGVGEVWRATDKKLGREVALKVLPEAFVSDPDRLARFEREAKLLASLNHPNIAHLYGLESVSIRMAAGTSNAGPVRAEPEGRSPMGHASRVPDTDFESPSEADAGPNSKHKTQNSKLPASAGTVTFLVMELVEGQAVFISATFVSPDNWTPDGRRLVYWEAGVQGGGSLWIRSLEGDANPRRLGQEHAMEWSSDLSSDGSWIAYSSDAARRGEVYVRALDSAIGEVRVSTEGGFAPCWREDGRELFYVDLNGRLMAVPVFSLDPPTFGSPFALFGARLEEATDRQYDVFADGQTFVLNRSRVEDGEPIVVVLGWPEKLEKEAR